MANLNSFRRGIKPSMSAEDVNQLLWNCTPYPFRKDLRKLRRSMRVHLRLGGGTIDGAVNEAHRRLDEAWDRYQRSSLENTAAALGGLIAL